MRLHNGHYSFSALASVTAAATFIALTIVPSSADVLPLVGDVELAPQSDKDPHEWGLRSRTVATLPPVQSDKNPHEWGLPSTTVASAPAAQPDKNPLAWGIVPATKAAQVVVKGR
jgi:hypothetical protein